MRNRTYLRVKVYEKQWGNFVGSYVSYFETKADIKDFEKRTGFKTEVLETIEL